MKAIPKYLLVIFLLTTFQALQAQIRFGQIFGVNLATMTLKTEGKNYVPKISPGIHFGGALEIPIAGNLIFQPALLFSAKGSVYETDSVEFSISPIYLEVPVMLFYSIGSENLRLTFYAGPYVACGIGGNTLATGGQFKNISFGNGEYDDLERFDIGMNMGAGLYIKGFLISAQYGSGLTNLAPSSKADTEIKNRVIAISLITSLSGRK